MKFTIQQIQEICKVINNDELVVIPSDTIYGVMASATSEHALSRLREVKQRGPDKAFIVLIASQEQLAYFDVPNEAIAAAMQHWPGPVSIVMDAKNASPLLNGGLEGVAFRMPSDPDIVALLQETGPLAAPSANPDSQPPAENIEQAKEYFKDQVAYYADYGTLTGKPSTLISIAADGSVTTIRE